MCRLKKRAAVRDVCKQTQSIHKTGEVLGITGNAVRRPLNAKEEPVCIRSPGETCLDPYKISSLNGDAGLCV